MFSNNAIIAYLLCLIIFLIIYSSYIEHYTQSSTEVTSANINNYYVFTVLNTISYKCNLTTKDTLDLSSFIQPTYIIIGTSEIYLYLYKNYTNTALLDKNKKNMKQISNGSLDKLTLTSYIYSSNITTRNYLYPSEANKIDKIQINYMNNDNSIIYSLTYKVSYA
jgi:hypothetical protein